MYRNDFANINCSRVYLPAIATDQNEVIPPRLSEVRGILLLPLGAPPPSLWTSPSGVEAISDNTTTDNTTAKWLTGRGEFPGGSPVVVQLGKREQRFRQSEFELTFEVNVYCDEIQTLLSRMSGGWKAFRFWLATRGNRLLGGANGIYPDFVTVNQPYNLDDVERGFININWFSKGSPTAATVENLFSDGSGSSPSPTPIENVMFYAQSFPSASSATLTWTENGGTLPLTNTQAQVYVYSNGRKLEETVEYTFNHASSPGESEIIINALTHFPGANYETIAVVTS